MRLVGRQEQLSYWWQVFAFVAISAFLLTIAVSAAPPLHQRIHRVQGAGHDCAATILSGGGLELCGSVIVAAAPANAPELYTVPSIARADLVCSLDFLLLEHAPPALS